MNCVAYSAAGGLLASCSDDGAAKVWGVGSSQVAFGPEGHAAEVSCVAFSLDGALVATGARDSLIKMWDARSGLLRRTLQGHSGPI